MYKDTVTFCINIFCAATQARTVLDPCLGVLDRYSSRSHLKYSQGAFFLGPNESQDLA